MKGLWKYFQLLIEMKHMLLGTSHCSCLEHCFLLQWSRFARDQKKSISFSPHQCWPERRTHRVLVEHDVLMLRLPSVEHRGSSEWAQVPQRQVRTAAANLGTTNRLYWLQRHLFSLPNHNTQRKRTNPQTKENKNTKQFGHTLTIWHIFRQALGQTGNLQILRNLENRVCVWEGGGAAKSNWGWICKSISFLSGRIFCPNFAEQKTPWLGLSFTGEGGGVSSPFSRSNIAIDAEEASRSACAAPRFARHTRPVIYVTIVHPVRQESLFRLIWKFPWAIWTYFSTTWHSFP